ncbi:MAG: FkbM family methyltransferase [Candidatus Velthaea sp.]|jgi:FkbM family methyltransferase
MTPEEFKAQVLQLFFQDIHKLEQNNYSPERFSYDGVDRSALFDVTKHAAYLDWFIQQYRNVFDGCVRLADQESRNLYVDVLRYKLVGHLHKRINTPVAAMGEETARLLEAFPGTESSIETSGMFGKLRHYDGYWKDVHYTVDTLKNALTSTLVYRQYYFERNGVSIQPEAGDFLIEGGACTGDTAAVFSRSVGPGGRVYAFDPVQDHIDVCRANFSRPGYENVDILPYGLGDRTIECAPIRLDTYSPGFRSAAHAVPLAKIDDFVANGRIERIDFIKLDIEGSEMAALRGAEQSIRRFRPKLAISVYHNPNDYFEIAQYIDSLGLGYKLYLDHYTIWDEETVLYARA